MSEVLSERTLIAMDELTALLRSQPETSSLPSAGEGQPLNVRTGLYLSEGEVGVVAGTLTQIRFRSPQSGWLAAELLTDTGMRLDIVGVLAEATVGQEYQLTGAVVRDARFGLQFEIQGVLADVEDASTVQAFLESGLIEGVGPATAQRIAIAWGSDALRVIMTDASSLAKIKGINADRAERIRRSVARQAHLAPVVGLLDRYGVSRSASERIWRRYGGHAVEIIRANPWRLADEIYGIGFTIADRIAGGLGFAPDSPERIRAGVQYSLRQAANDGRGHTYLRYDELVRETASLLGVEYGPVRAELSTMIADSQLIDLPAVRGYALPRLARAESTISSALRRIADFADEPIEVSEDELAAVQASSGLTFDSSQSAAVIGSLAQRITVITGNPGTGKTTSLRAVLDIAESHGLRCALVSPTGRAAKRLTEAVGRPASTIHRWLRYHPQIGFRGPLDNPDLLVIDEASMLDVNLAAQLLTMLPPFVRLIIVGDVDQLPSIGPGNVMADIMAWQQTRVFRLRHIFRTAAGSGIPGLCAQVLSGRRAPAFDGISTQFIEQAEAEGIRDWVAGFFASHTDMADRIQVLIPMKKGVAGTIEMNNVIQRIVNPLTEDEYCVRRAGSDIHVGDRVMQTSNYRYINDAGEEFMLANGEIGIVRELDEAGITLELDGERVSLPSNATQGLALAYAISVHKGQGSEFPVVITAIHGSYFKLLEKRLVYTAFSRAKERLLVVGTRRALAMAIGNDKGVERQTLLPSLLTGQVSALAELDAPRPAGVDELDDVDF